jgi:ribose 5-phosphate isomerase RpiB
MIFTARQLEDLHKANGHVALPRAARLTPLAQDWLKHRKLAVVYTDLSDTAAAPLTAATVSLPHTALRTPHSATAHLWWCDGPCGVAKAALSSHRDAPLTPLPVAADSGKTLAAVKEIAAALKGGNAAGALLFVQSSAGAMVYLNRCPSVRAVLGTSLQTVDVAIRTLAANVLVIEYPTQTLQQMKNLIGRFVKAKRELSPETQLALEELASCG